MEVHFYFPKLIDKSYVFTIEGENNIVYVISHVIAIFPGQNQEVAKVNAS